MSQAIGHERQEQGEELPPNWTSDLLTLLGETADLQTFRRGVTDLLSRRFPRMLFVWMRQAKSGWDAVGLSQHGAALPIDAVAEACDSQDLQRADRWLIAPLNRGAEVPEALLVAPSHGLSRSAAEELTGSLRVAIRLLQSKSATAARLDQVQLLLTLASTWQRKHNLSELLNEMARAAAQALRGDRASIFLWDRSAGELVAHPALGVEGQELRIRDDQGIAGRVMHSAVSERWDAEDDPKAVDHRVGERLGYMTRSLVAVPLLDGRGKPMGVFEVLNHRDGRFSADDERFLAEVASLASAALENTRRIDELVRTRDRLVKSAGDSLQLVGNCSAIQSLRDTIARVGPTDLAVLLLGENGTGKEVVSRSLHLQSRRNAQPFIAVNCAAIAETLLESELFGHEKGAFTDAVSARAGKFELASGGTLLLDEIGEMSLGGQAKLLRVLEDKIVVRVGGSTPIRTDVRVIAATNQNLVELVRQRKFREDLYFRLNVVTLSLPPLRDRGEDILMLAQHFLESFSHQIGRRTPTLSDRARQRLLAHSWPGNVRELRNQMERLAYLCSAPQVEEHDLAFVLSPSGSGDPAKIPGTLSLTEATHLFQIEYIQRHVDATDGNLAQAAERLGLHRSNLYRKMKQLGMDPEP
ncbi:MAG: sigma-54-dependent Fis family transcriptional regulator [Pirellulales bacterium]